MDLIESRDEPPPGRGGVIMWVSLWRNFVLLFIWMLCSCDMWCEPPPMWGWSNLKSWFYVFPCKVMWLFACMVLSYPTVKHLCLRALAGELLYYQSMVFAPWGVFPMSTSEAPWQTGSALTVLCLYLMDMFCICWQFLILQTDDVLCIVSPVPGDNSLYEIVLPCWWTTSHVGVD